MRCHGNQWDRGVDMWQKGYQLAGGARVRHHEYCVILEPVSVSTELFRAVTHRFDGAEISVQGICRI